MKMYNYKNKKCIVSGGSGFIGQNLVNKLISQGAKVWVIDNFSFGASRKNVNKKAKIIFGDIRNEKKFNNLPRKADYFFHFAGPSSTILFSKYPKDAFDITIRGFVNVINFCAENKTRLIYPSSGKVYMGNKGVLSENMTIKEDKLDDYARAKYAKEKIAFAYKGLVSSVGLRIFTGYGPSEKHKKDFASTVYMFSKDAFENKRPIVWGNGRQKRDFIFIDDLVNMVLTFGQKSKEPIINVGTGTSATYNQLIKAIGFALNKKISPKYLEKKNFFNGNTLANTKIIQKYYSEPLCSLECGVKRIVDSLI